MIERRKSMGGKKKKIAKAKSNALVRIEGCLACAGVSGRCFVKPIPTPRSSVFVSTFVWAAQTFSSHLGSLPAKVGDGGFCQHFQRSSLALATCLVRLSRAGLPSPLPSGKSSSLWSFFAQACGAQSTFVCVLRALRSSLNCFRTCSSRSDEFETNLALTAQILDTHAHVIPASLFWSYSSSSPAFPFNFLASQIP